MDERCPECGAGDGHDDNCIGVELTLLRAVALAAKDHLEGPSMSMAVDRKHLIQLIELREKQLEKALKAWDSFLGKK